MRKANGSWPENRILLWQRPDGRVVRKITGKTVYIVADFPKHKGKIVKRSAFALEQKAKPKKKAKEKSKKAE